jgi:hypothetical protein
LWRVGGSFKRRCYAGRHLVLMKWFGQDVECSSAKEFRLHRSARPSGHEDDRDVVSNRYQATKEDLGGASRRLYITNDAPNVVKVIERKKVLDGRKLLRPEVHRGHEALHAIANKRVVINNRYDTAVHREQRSCRAIDNADERRWIPLHKCQFDTRNPPLRIGQLYLGIGESNQ